MKRTASLFSMFAIGAVLAAPTFAQDKAPAAPKDKPAAAEPTKEKQPKEKQDKKDEKAKGDVAPGMPAPNFTGTDTEGKSHTLADLTKSGKVVVLQWFNAECPYVVKHYKDSKTFNDLHAKYAAKGVEFFAIASNAPGNQGGGKDFNAKAKKDWKIPYPILVDESGAIGMAYGAKQTPTMVVIDKNGTIAYWGGIDDDNGAEKPGKTNYVAKALDEILAGSNVTTAKTAAYGCRIKYGKN